MTSTRIHAILCKAVGFTETVRRHPMFEKDLHFIMLFDFYGELLTDTQKTMFDLYYNNDLSLAEISENTGITRQGVRDSIKRSEEQLLAYEEALGLAGKAKHTEELLAEVRPIIQALREKHPEEAADLDKVMELINAAFL